MSDPSLIVAVSSRALFDFEEENRVFDAQGPDPYRKLQKKRLDTVAAAGIAFPLVRKLLALKDKDGQPLVEVVVLSRNDPVTGLRVFRSISDNKLRIRRAVFTRGTEPFPYLHPLGAQLFLSAHRKDVRDALAMNIPAALVQNPVGDYDAAGDKALRIAFDGDAVLFEDGAERHYQEKGLSAFMRKEKGLRNSPLLPGPLHPFLTALHNLRKRLPKTPSWQRRVRIALVTARGAPAHERPIRTLMEWGIEVDEAMFLSGAKKREFLNVFRPDFFFDDQLRHIRGAKETRAGHVPYGVRNTRKNASKK